MTVTLSKEKRKKISFFREVQQELKKVSWTSKDELKVSTKIVIGSTFAFGIAIYITDLMIKGFLDGLSWTVRLIGG